jgi:tRNA threonylcarbamoyladenosine biosynthesis protein TsaE
MTPILDEHMLEFVSRSPQQTQRLGARLGSLLQGGHTICLEGTLGAGKTCLAQGIGRGWGISQNLISPTFVIIRQYTHPHNDLVLYHIDLYRINGIEEARSLGLDEFLGDKQALCLIEWAERIRSLIPKEHLWVRLEIADPMRRALYLSAQGKHHMALLQEFRQSAFGA